MKKICTIANNNGKQDDRVTIMWSEDDKHLYGASKAGTEQCEETAETYEDACKLAAKLWDVTYWDRRDA